MLFGYVLSQSSLDGHVQRGCLRPPSASVGLSSELGVPHANATCTPVSHLVLYITLLESGARLLSSGPARGPGWLAGTVAPTGPPQSALP